MAAARKDLEARVRQTSHETPAGREREDAVAVPPEDERLVRDPREIAGLHRVLPCRHRRDEFHELRPVPPAPLVERGGERDERMPEKARVHARRQEAPRVFVAARHERQRGREEIDGLGHRLSRRVDEDEPPHEARVATHEVERHRAAERVPEQVHAPWPVGQRFDGAHDGIGEQADAVFNAGAGGLVAPAVPEQVHCQDPPPPCEERQRERPLTAVRPDAMQEDERRRTLRAGGARLEAGHVEARRKREPETLQYFRINTSASGRRPRPAP